MRPLAIRSCKGGVRKGTVVVVEDIDQQYCLLLMAISGNFRKPENF